MKRLLKLRRVVVLKCFALLGVASLLVTLATSRTSSSRGDVGELEDAARDMLERTKGRRGGLEIRAGIRSENVNSVGSIRIPGLLRPDREVGGTLQGQRHEQAQELSRDLTEDEPFDHEQNAVDPFAAAGHHVPDDDDMLRARDPWPGGNAESEFADGRDEPFVRDDEAPRANVDLVHGGDADVSDPKRQAAEVEPEKKAAPAARKSPSSTVLKQKRVRLVRKTIRHGKVINEEVLGVKTMIVDGKGKPVKNQRAAYDEIWYSDILKGNYRARTVHLTNVTNQGRYLTEELWKFDDPNSERLFLYNKLLQHDWHVNRTNLDILRRELAEDGVDSRHTLIMTRENSPIGSQYPFYASSRVMSFGKETQRLYYYNVTKELHRHIPEVSPFREKLYKKCAVVGNSGSLLNSGCGSEIDSSDMVFRCNAAPLRKFAEDAGWKSNITTFNPSIFHKKFNGLTRPEDYAAFRENITEYHGYVWMTCIGAASLYNVCLSTVQDEANTDQADPRLVVAHSNEFVNFWNFWKRRNFTNQPSTGFYMVHVAMQLCEETHVYGFWPFPLRLDTGFERVPYHYFDDVLLEKKHGMNSEFSNLLQYHELGLLRLHTGVCRGG
ncbi:alpha-2,8-sialyltransferase 8F-like [Diadema setosum]|uniref:alpha-2,8-sialyltransferase 8F-like n=1 Tax=Diadema setosum TaxID=31175 RepID=UPI003B3B750C